MSVDAEWPESSVAAPVPYIVHGEQNLSEDVLAGGRSGGTRGQLGVFGTVFGYHKR
jgi:hypothetical protein